MKKSHFWSVALWLVALPLGLFVITCYARDDAALYLATYIVGGFVVLVSLGALRFVRSRN